MVDQTNMKTMQGSMRPRSATAPTARATLCFISISPFHRVKRCYSRDGSEHSLVDGEKKIRNLGATDGGGTQDILETKVAQVSNVLAGGVREGERVAPEEPLEGDDADGHDGQPYQGKG